MQFLINLHIAMFYAVFVAGIICAIWGLGLFIARYQAAKQAAQEQANARAQQSVAETTPTATATPAQPRQSAISPLFRSALRVTAYLALIQVVIGGLIFFFLPDNRASDQLHYVYGLVVLLAIPLALTYMSGKPQHIRRDLLFLIAAAIVAAAAAVRAALTGGFQF